MDNPTDIVFFARPDLEDSGDESLEGSLDFDDVPMHGSDPPWLPHFVNPVHSLNAVDPVMFEIPGRAKYS